MLLSLRLALTPPTAAVPLPPQDRIVNELYSEHITHGDLALVNAREATRDPYRGDPKCTGEKIVAWFQQVVVTHRNTRFFIKADWDTYAAPPIQLPRCEPPRLSPCKTGRGDAGGSTRRGSR